MCLEQSLMIELVAIAIALWESKKISVEEEGNPRWLRSCWIHKASEVASRDDLYLASIDEDEVMGCFWDLQEIIPMPNLKQCLDIEWQVSIQLANLTSI